jgi:hypothetical protein
LLGYAKPEDALLCSRRAAGGKQMVKLTLGSKPVPIALPARVAMARLGDRGALLQLRESFEKPDLPVTLFLLGVLRDIEDHDALKAAVSLLDDDRQAPGVVAHGSRKVRDVCLEALVARLSLTPSFQVKPGRHYTPTEIAEVRSAAGLALSATGQSATSLRNS